MTDDRSRILGMVAEGKLSVDEASRLLDALGSRDEAPAAPAPGIKGDPTPLIKALPKYLFVKVNSADGDNLDVKIPVALIRSGLKLTSLIPPQAMEQLSGSMAEHGMSIDFTNLKPEDIDDIVEALREMEVSVDSANGDKVRVYAE